MPTDNVYKAGYKENIRAVEAVSTSQLMSKSYTDDGSNKSDDGSNEGRGGQRDEDQQGEGYGDADVFFNEMMLLKDPALIGMSRKDNKLSQDIIKGRRRVRRLIRLI